MANHEHDGIGDEDELFSEMLSGDAPKFDAEPDGTGTDEPAALEPEKATRERDEFGRFKSKASDTQDAPAEAEPQKQVETPVEAAAQEPEAPPQQPPAKEDDGGNVPSWRVREINEKLRDERKAREETEHAARTYQAQAAQFQQHIVALQQQLQALQNPKPQQPEPNLFEDPEQFVRSVREEIAAAKTTAAIEANRNHFMHGCAVAAHIYGDKFNEALNALDRATQEEKAKRGTCSLRDELIGPPGRLDPAFVNNILGWYNKEKTLQEVGSDPAAYRERVRAEAKAELKADQTFRAELLESLRAEASGRPATAPGQVAPRPNTVTQLPPSLRSVPGAAASSQSTGLESLNDEELFDSIARR